MQFERTANASQPRRDGSCGISDDDLELLAMGRLADPFIRRHLETCASCHSRVEQRRDDIALLKIALLEWRRDHGPVSVVSPIKKCSKRTKSSLA
jgi:hypothetical protein